MKNFFIIFLLFISISLQTQCQIIDFKAKGIIALMDNDMVPSVLIDSITKKEKNSKDHFYSFKLPIERSFEDPKPIIVSNSFLGFCQPMAVSPDGKLVFVIETKGNTHDSVQHVVSIEKSIPNGNFITVVDISDANKPVSKFKIPVGRNPLSVSLDSSGRNIAITTSEYGKELVVLEIDESGKPSKPLQKPANFPNGRILNLAWHPSGNYIAIIVEDMREVAILKVMRDLTSNKPYRLEMLGKPVKVGETPFNLKFTPNGKHLIINNFNSKLIKNESGKLFILKPNLDGLNDHILLSSLKVVAFSPNFDISSDSKMLALASSKTSFYPIKHTEFKAESEISLYSIDADGTLEIKSTLPVNGSFVNSIIFDKTGENLMINVFEYFNFGKKIGGIQFYSVDKNNFTFKKQESNIVLPKGCHSVNVIR